MHVLVITPVFPHPGNPVEGLFNEQHAQALARKGLRVTVVVSKPWLPKTFSKVWNRYRALAQFPLSEERDGLRIVYSPYLHIPQYRWPQLAITSCVYSVLRTVKAFGRNETFDLIQVHGAWPAGLASPRIARSLDCPFVVTLHIQDEPRLSASIKGTGLRNLMFKEASAVVVVGHALERFVRETVPQLEMKSIRVIPNGIDVAAVQEVLRGIPAMNKGGHIVSVGNLWAIKGIDLNIKALAQLDRKGIPWKDYSVVGDGPEKTRLEKLAGDLGIENRVHFRGRLPHKETLREIAQADIFSLPSWQEAFGVVYLEAMACGKAVIGCRGQGAEDIIRHEKDGLLVKPNDVEDLANLLKPLLEKPEFAARLGKSGICRAREFAWTHNVEKYLEIYREVCAS